MSMVTLSAEDVSELANLLVYVKANTIPFRAEWVGPQLDKWCEFLCATNDAIGMKEVREASGPGARV
jgi:hypothetical protein